MFKKTLSILLAVLFSTNSVANSSSVKIVTLDEYLSVVENNGKPLTLEDVEIQNLAHLSRQSKYLAEIAKNVAEAKKADIEVKRALIENQNVEKRSVESNPLGASFNGMPFGNVGAQHSVQQKASTSPTNISLRDIKNGVAYLSIDGQSFAARQGFQHGVVKIESVGPNKINVLDDGVSRTVHMSSISIRAIPNVSALRGPAE